MDFGTTNCPLLVSVAAGIPPPVARKLEILTLL
jgi:hypothetical protein